MSKLDIVKSVTIVEEGREKDRPKAIRAEEHTVSLVEGEPVAVDGVRAVITVQITDPERDAATLLRAAQELLPIYRKAPGIVVTDEEGAVEGIAPRAELEEAVLQMRAREHAALAKGLGLRVDLAGLIDAPFVYWKCPDPDCACIRVPQVGHEDDPPPACRLHDPPLQMERHVHGGE